MKKDITVTIAIIILGIWIFSSLLELIPSFISANGDESTFVKVFGIIGGLAILRIMVLFFQTLIHAVHHAEPSSKTGIVLKHLFLGPLYSIPYYYFSRILSRPAKAPIQRPQPVRNDDHQSLNF